MSSESHHDRTEAATPRRLDEAWQKGQVAVSPDLASAFALLAAAVGLRFIGPQLTGGLARHLKMQLPALPHNGWNVAEVSVWSRWFLTEFLVLTALTVGGLMVISLLTTLLQSGVRVSTESLAINWSRLDPVAGWSKVMSTDSLVRGLLAGLKLVLALSVAIAVIWSQAGPLRLQSRGRLLPAIRAGWGTAMDILTWLACGALMLAVLDYLFKRFRHHQNLRMTRQEVQDESKEEQGHPLIRSQRRARQRDAAARKSLRSVPEATLVVTNPTHYAVALQYRQGQPGAPRVLAKGKGRLALQIRELANQHGIPIREHKPLARALYRLAEVGREIPLELYQAVAEILAQLYRRRHAG